MNKENWIIEQRLLNEKYRLEKLADPEKWEEKNRRWEKYKKNEGIISSNTYSSGRVRKEDDEIFCGILMNQDASKPELLGDMITFVLDEIGTVYEYDEQFSTTMMPNLKLKELV